MLEKKIFALLLVGAAALGGCTAQGERTLATGALGAGTGAIIGAIGGNTGLGAIVGGVVGAGAGYLTCQKTVQGRCR